jgi:MinD-like ATPase involved in chromosome partitioning or flagellar assembly
VALVALTSVKGAPGVTTAALALASAWPAHRRIVLVEADPAGGDIAARFGLPADPSMVSLATSLRHERASAAGAALLGYCQELPGGLRVLTAPVSPTEARFALDMAADSLAGLAADSRVDVIVDCGRIEASTLPSTSEAGGTRPIAAPVTRLLMQADAVLVITSGELADLSHVQARLPTLRALNPNLSLVVRPPQIWSTDEIERELDVQIVGTLPSDAVSADVLAGREHSRHVARLPLFRAATAIAEHLVGHLPGVASEVAAPAVADGDMTAPLRTGGVPAQ